MAEMSQAERTAMETTIAQAPVEVERDHELPLDEESRDHVEDGARFGWQIGRDYGREHERALEDALREALDYVPDYFREKWNLDAELKSQPDCGPGKPGSIVLTENDLAEICEGGCVVRNGVSITYD